MFFISDIQEVFLSTNQDGTFNFVILYKNGVTKTTVKKFSKAKKLRKEIFLSISSIRFKEMTCNHFSNYHNDAIGVFNQGTHFLFVVINKDPDGLHLSFTIKKEQEKV